VGVGDSYSHHPPKLGALNSLLIYVISATVDVNSICDFLMCDEKKPI
jgi:hypothetical protein